MLCGAVPIVFASPAFAQEAPPPETPPQDVSLYPDEPPPGEIIVTGSRIVRDGYDAPTPTTVISVEDIEAQNPANLADYVNQLPQLLGSTSPRATLSNSNTNVGSANILNMRGLGTTRTLVLFDGHRVVASTSNNGVDTNLLPTNLVQRVDVVTGGASAAYGSDAVAGVTNFILDTHFTGLKGSAQFGITDHGDGDTWSGDVAFGTGFAGDRGHILLSVAGRTQQGIDTVLTRSWYNPGFGFIANPAWTPTNGQPARILRNDVGLTNATDGGLIMSGPMRGTTFLGNGETGQFIFGDIVSGNSQAGGTLQDGGFTAPLLSKMHYWTRFARLSYEFTPKFRGYAEYGGGDSTSYNWSAIPRRYGNIVIQKDNYFLKDYPDVLANAFGAGNTIRLGRMNYDMHAPGGHPTDLSYSRGQNRFLAGLEFDFLDTGRLNAYYSNGVSKLRYTYNNMLIPAYYDLAVDAIANPAVGGVAGVPVGAPICRSTLNDPANGCVPMNIFGPEANQDAIAYVTGVTKGFPPGYQNQTIKQQVWSLSGQIDPFSTWAGPVSIAAGFEYRKETFKAVVDQASTDHLWYGGGFSPGGGGFDVKEFFGEAIVPLLRDIPLAKSLDVNGAVRFTDYSYSGKVTTWKTGATWDVYDDLRLRGTLSRDIRAPNLQELFDGGRPFVGSVIDPTQVDSAHPSGTTVAISYISGGNPNLTPEIANTRTFGAVYQPSWLRGFSFSADYYKISIKDAIVPLGTQQIVDQCYGVNGIPKNPAACAAITYANPNNLIDAHLRTGSVNASRQAMSGIDFETSYRTAIDPLDARLELRLLASRRLSEWTILNNEKTNDAGTPGNPKWRGIFTAGFIKGPSRTTATVRYYGSGVVNHWPYSDTRSVDVNHYDSTAYLDLAENYDVTIGGAKTTLFGVVENVFDTDPVVVPGGQFGTNSIYELLGRSFRLGLRFKF
jgi:outer membrane receptor protein involved in Fe transport